MKGNLLVMLVLMSFISSPLRMLYGVENNNQKEKDFLTFVEKGKELYKEKKFDEAQKAFNQAKEIKPDHNGPYLGIGLCQEKLGQYEAAEKEFLLALERANDNQRRSIICDNLGYLYHLEKKFSEAVDYYTKAIGYSSDPKDIYVRLANLYSDYSISLFANGDYKLAEEVIKKAINIRNDFSIYHHNYGAILLDQGKTDQAIDEFNTALGLGFKDERLFYQLAQSYINKKDFKKALEYIQLAIRYGPKVCSNYHKLGEIYCSLGEYEKGIEAYQKALSLKEISIVYNDMGKAYLKLEKYEKALGSFENAAKIQDDFSKKNLDYIYYDIGRCYFELKNYNEALRYFDEVIKVDDRFSWAYEKKGEIYLLKGDRETSIQNFKQASELASKNAKLHFRAGLFIYRNAHNADDCRLALIYLNKAYDLDSKNVDIIYLIAGSYYYLNEIEKAQKFVKIGLSIQPDYEDLNKLNKKIQQKEEGKENIESLIILHPPSDSTLPVQNKDSK